MAIWKETRAKHQDKLRTSVFDHYGHICKCCGGAQNLTIDHIIPVDDPSSRKGVTGYKFYAWLVANDFPPGYQVLCNPCNNSKQRGNVCRLIHSINSKHYLAVSSQGSSRITKNGTYHRGFAIRFDDIKEEKDVRLAAEAIMRERDERDAWPWQEAA